LVVDVNSVSNGLQVIYGFIFRRKNSRKRTEKGATETVFLPPVTPGSPILPWNQFPVNPMVHHEPWEAVIFKPMATQNRYPIPG